MITAQMTAQPTLLDQIRQILEGSEAGILLLGREPENIKVFCRNGLVEAVSSNLDQHRLGQYMLREGFIEPPALNELLAESRRRGVLIGQAALQSKALGPAELGDVIRRQAFQLLKYALEKQMLVQSFLTSDTSFPVPAGIHFEYLLLELARNNSRPLEIQPWQLIVMDSARDLSHLPWYPQELSVLNELRNPHTFESLAASTGLEFLHLGKILDVFVNLHLIEIVDETTPEDEAKESRAVVRRPPFPFEHLIPEASNAVLSEKIEVLKSEYSFIGEQFNTLKVRIHEIQAEHPIKAITISSPEAQDGKSLIAVNLAFCLAQDPDRRVIIIDGDLRNPTLDKYLGIPIEPGLIGYLENDNMQSYCFMRRIKNLYILTVGGSTARPMELLSHERMRELVQYLRSQFDTIIIDAPPFSPISDARILMGMTDGLVLVVRRDKTPRRSVERAFKVLDRKKLLGVVFNDVKPMLFHTHYDHSYYRYGKDSRYPYYGARKQRPRSKTYLES